MTGRLSLGPGRVRLRNAQYLGLNREPCTRATLKTSSLLVILIHHLHLALATNIFNEVGGLIIINPDSTDGPIGIDYSFSPRP